MQTKTFDLLSVTGISIVFLFVTSIIPLCQTAAGDAHAIPCCLLALSTWPHHATFPTGVGRTLFSTLESLSIHVHQAYVVQCA